MLKYYRKMTLLKKMWAANLYILTYYVKTVVYVDFNRYALDEVVSVV